MGNKMPAWASSKKIIGYTSIVLVRSSSRQTDGRDCTIREAIVRDDKRREVAKVRLE